MLSIFLIGLYLVSSVYGATGKNWALLVAGSNGYDNYRHQADICHAYQIMHNHGIPDENIVVMMYDDIAANKENPTKGIIINKPNGKDVYAGVLKDYIKTAVTPANFLNVLSGKQDEVRGIGSGKVINSGPNDNVFVFFADHGAPGLIAFPNNKVLQASALNKTLYSMYQNKQYKHMVIYIEACESGSMFDGLLPPNIDIYATTAANPDESSYACYWDNKRQTYLGDVYSVMWMEDSDREDLSKETLFQQFQIVQKETNTSHVMQYGNLTMNKFFLNQFQGNATPTYQGEPSDYAAILSDVVPTQDVKSTILRRKYEAEQDPAKKAELLAKLESLLKEYRVATTLIKEIPSVIYKSNQFRVNKILNEKLRLRNHECYAPVIDYMTESSCLSFENEYVLKNLYVIVNLCETGITSDRIMKAIDTVCAGKDSLY